MTSPLQDKLFISTRPKGSSDELSELLTREGAMVMEFPLIETGMAILSEEEKTYFIELHRFQWIVFTSPNGVRYFFKHLKTLSGSHHLPQNIQLAVIGDKTGEVVQSFGHKASFSNPGSTAEDFSAPFLRHLKSGVNKPNILLPLGNLARNVIQNHLKDTANCFRVTTYHTKIPEKINEEIVQLIEQDRYAMLLFSSPSGIQNFLKVAPPVSRKTFRLACIGPVTQQEAMKCGFLPLVTAEKSTAAGIVESILNYYISKT